MFDRLTAIETRYDELMRLLGDAGVQSNPDEYRKHAKSLAELQPLVETFREYKRVLIEITQTEELARTGDTDMRDLADQELRSLSSRRRAKVAQRFSRVRRGVVNICKTGTSAAGSGESR